MMVRQLLKDNPTPSEDDVKHYLIGNLCRCSAYPEILEAVKLAGPDYLRRLLDDEYWSQKRGR